MERVVTAARRVISDSGDDSAGRSGGAPGEADDRVAQLLRRVPTPLLGLCLSAVNSALSRLSRRPQRAALPPAGDVRH